MAQIGKHIKKFRTELHITQEELADKMHVTRQTISGWETGRTQPDLDMLTRLADLLQVSVEELIYGRKNAQSNIRTGWKKRLAIALIWSVVTVFWFVISYKYAHYLSRHALDMDVQGLFIWYYVFKPLRFVFLSITVLTFIRVFVNVHVPHKWLRVLLIAVALAFVVVFVATMYAIWFGDASVELRMTLFMFFNKITLLDLEVFYALPTVAMYLGIARKAY